MKKLLQKQIFQTACLMTMLFGISSVMRAQGSICIKVDGDTENLKWGENIEDQLWKINDVSLNEGCTCVLCWSESPEESLDISEYNLCEGLVSSDDYKSFSVSESGTYSFTYSENNTLTATRFDCDKPADNAIWIGVEDAAEDEDWNSLFSFFHDEETDFGFKEITYNETLGKYIATFTGPVTKIPYEAFNDWSRLTSIVLPECVTIIDEEAFSRTSITSITIPESVESIGDYAFYNSSLTSIEIPKGVKSIGKAILGGCSDLTSITVAADNECFDSRNDCNAIIETGTNMLVAACMNTFIPNTVTSIGKCAYQEIPLTSISIPESVESIVDGAFMNFPLETIAIPESVTTIGESVFMSASLTNITIPSSVTSIGDGAFNYCESLASITMLSSTPPTLGENVWWGISSDPKPTLIVPSDAESAYEAAGWYTWFAFPGSSAPADNEIWFTIEGSAPVTWDYYFVGCSPRPTITKVGDHYVAKFESDVTSIPDNAFNQKIALTSVTIPAKVETIGEEAFYRCTNLTEIKFAEDGNLKEIGEYAFYGTAFTSIAIPASVETIGYKAFYDCESLTEIKFAEDGNLKEIGDEAFYASAITSITIPASVETIGNNPFYGTPTLESITVAADNKKFDCRNNCNAIIEKETNTLVSGCKNTVIPTDVVCIGPVAFSFMGLTSVEIPANVKTIGEAGFDGNNLTSVKFAEGIQLETLEDMVFAENPLTSIDIPSTVTSIGDGAFIECEKLSEITIPANVKSIGTQAFVMCPSLTTVKFEEDSKLESIGMLAFAMTGLTSITIPASVKTINIMAFAYSSDLTSVTMESETPFELTEVDGSSLHMGEGMVTTWDGLNTDPKPTLIVPSNSDLDYIEAGWNKWFNINAFGLKVSDLGWASLYYDKDLKIPNGVKVYYASEQNKDVVSLEEINGIIPAETAVIVNGVPETYAFPFAEVKVDPLADGANLFKGLLENTLTEEIQAENVGKTLYVLAEKDANGKPIFMKYLGETLGAYKMYMPIEGDASQIKFVVKGDDDFADGIVNIADEAADSRMYNTLGMPVSNSYKGIIMKGGKKFMNIKR